MRIVLISAVAIFLALSSPGCGRSGPEMLKTRGQVVKGNVAFAPEEGQKLQIVFSPISSDGSPPKNMYIADVNQKTGAFHAAGPHLQGLPPGKYRVGVELRKNKKDLLNAKFNIESSPFVFDIDRNSKPITIDLDFDGGSTQQIRQANLTQ